MTVDLNGIVSQLSALGNVSSFQNFASDTKLGTQPLINFSTDISHNIDSLSHQIKVQFINSLNEVLNKQDLSDLDIKTLLKLLLLLTFTEAIKNPNQVNIGNVFAVMYLINLLG
jgi:hypothetical protein